MVPARAGTHIIQITIISRRLHTNVHAHLGLMRPFLSRASYSGMVQTLPEKVTLAGEKGISPDCIVHLGGGKDGKKVGAHRHRETHFLPA